MQISSSSSNYWLQQLQQDLQGLTGSLGSVTNALQLLPSTGQDSQSSGTTSSSAATASAGSTTGAGLLGSDALSWLITSEQSAPAALANDVIQSVNPGGDGVSLQQVATATGQSADSLSGAFSALDTNGDGQLSQAELTSALTNLLQTAQGDAESLAGIGGRHHHHHHNSDASQPASSTTDSSSTTSTASSSSDSTSSGTGSATSTTGA